MIAVVTLRTWPRLVPCTDQRPPNTPGAAGYMIHYPAMQIVFIDFEHKPGPAWKVEL